MKSVDQLVGGKLLTPTQIQLVSPDLIFTLRARKPNRKQGKAKNATHEKPLSANPRIIIFMIGSISYSEVRAAYETSGFSDSKPYTTVQQKGW